MLLMAYACWHFYQTNRHAYHYNIVTDRRCAGERLPRLPRLNQKTTFTELKSMEGTMLLSSIQELIVYFDQSLQAPLMLVLRIMTI